MHVILAAAAGSFTPVATDAVNLANSADTAMLVMVPVIAGALVGWHAFQRSNATDETEGMQAQRRIRTTIVYAIVAEVGMVLAKAVLGFFGS